MPPEVRNSTSGSTNPGGALASEDYSFKSYRNQLEQQHRLEIEALEKSNREELAHALEEHEKKKELLRKDFDVAISLEAGQMDASLAQVHENGQQRVAEEKRHSDEELIKVRRAYAQKIEEYKRVSESQLDAQRKEIQATAETLQDKQRMLERKDRELEKASNSRRPKV